MSSYLQKAGTKLFEQHLEQYSPADPLYEYYTDERGRQKRKKRDTPPGLSARDAKILKSVQRRAHYLDKGFTICGFRFGWTFIIGIIPAAGDVADVGLNYFLVVRKARQAELPGWLVRRMLINNAVSALSGLIPVAGDVVLALYKANSRNAALLEEFLRIRGEEFLSLQAAQRAEAQAKAQGSKSDAVTPSKNDMVQMKPGAGMGAEDMPGGTMEPAKSASGRRSFPSWRGTRKDKQKASSGDRGRFVEDVGSGSGSSTNARNDSMVQKN
ncbi:hypothetical protein BV22DRAFT_1038312 [Leucogyrophana mollusca]|uniref:Uncharacterized protein n=1 Tax=Leucogyrophana mollusca TaxID=85980 RepID=A0ACB8B7T3_9AGAM|nr:hypothetical protein BV22DRAFT_1038312 [Leucogyrophana mollusca]